MLQVEAITFPKTDLHLRCTESTVIRGETVCVKEMKRIDLNGSELELTP